MPSNFKLQSQASSLHSGARKSKKQKHQFVIAARCVKGAHDAPVSFVRVQLLQRRRPPYNYYAMSKITRHEPLLLIFFNIVITSCFVSCSSLTDSQTLLTLKQSFSNPTALANWDDRTPPCNENGANWNGVLCHRGKIWGLKLEDMGLQGNIDITILKELREMRTLSLMRNNLEGPMPDLRQLSNGALRSVYLSNNRFSGEIPTDAFDGMTSLRKLLLADNQFNGPIPESLTRLSRLVELRLEGNKFEGQIPDFQQKDLVSFNVSNNALFGSISPALRELDPSSFSAPPPGNDSVGSGSSNSTLVLASATTASVVAIAAVVAAIFVIERKRKRERGVSIENPPPLPPPSSNLQKTSGIRESGQCSPSSTEAVVGGKKPEIKLSFVRDDVERFDLHDLLRASAEILGSGCFGSSYKASLSTGAMMVVKRFKQMNNVGREEFQEHMRRLGRLRHPNLLPLVAYYYRKEEKLLVHEFVPKRSLAVNLHGHQALGQPSLDWPSRLKIVKGVAKGLQYLCRELPSLIAPHGHIKSSNVLLNESLEPVLADYGLIPVMNQESAQELMIAYKSPEFLQLGRITKKTDVWSLGVLILEIMTGKFPANFLQQGKKADGDLASWVNSVLANGDNRTEVFDKEMSDERNSEGEMVKLLKIGLACCEEEVEKRLDLKEAVEKIEEVKERDGDEDFYSSYASEADLRSPRGKSDEFTFS
ncbi:pollen receptor-like kinase 1 [Citrus sinensis]|uniref:Pollen receptor-like kinase 1 n=1 Tax=Citrus sinensis TaxID=2711 RepID=A0ACB8P658_CITSI|nr:pollen receptor-like kinase 1 [Citrus sinensis]